MIDKTLVNRSLSLLTCGALFFFLWHKEASFLYAMRMSPAFLFTLALIWFGDYFGSKLGLAGFSGSYTYIDKPTPGWLVAAAGWVFLLGVPLLSWLLGS